MVNPQVLKDIEAERDSQRKQWGGTEHDDMHGPHDWVNYIDKQVKAAEMLYTQGRELDRSIQQAGEPASVQWRARMVKIAALAIAAIESYDRIRAEDDAVLGDK